MVDILSGLNPMQRSAVEHREGPALVLAGAGSGKTRVITCRVANLISRGIARPENILAVTFTNKAAREMRDRVHHLLGEERIAEPLIATFHSFCVRLLRHEIHLLGFRRDFSIYDTEDQQRLMKQVMKENRVDEGAQWPKTVLSRISYAKNHHVEPQNYARRFPSKDAEDIQWAYERYAQRLRQANALDFDDLLLKAVEVLSRHPDRRDHYSRRFRYILVDEYQDTNRPQYRLLQLLTATHRNLFAVGDEDQSIYKFRGADIGNILGFEEDFPGTRIIKLEQNYRSTQNILKVAGSVVDHNTARKGKTLWTDNHTGDVVTLHRLRSARAEAVWIGQRIEEIVRDQPEVRIGILYRANFLSRNFEDVFREMGIPYCLVGTVGFFNRAEVKDMLAFLRVVFNPEDDVALLRILNTPPRGIGGTTQESLTAQALAQGAPVLDVIRRRAATEGNARTRRALAQFVDLVDRWITLKDTGPVAGLVQAIVHDTRYSNMLEKQGSQEEAESRIANIDELVRAMYESEARGETVFDFLDRASLASETDRYDPNARVAIMTLHSAKGLEFDVVFLAGMEEGLFPHAQSSRSGEDLEEERRLCYVGITRARRKLYLTWTPYRRSFGSEGEAASLPSRFLDEMPKELVEGMEESRWDGFPAEEGESRNWWQRAARMSRMRDEIPEEDETGSFGRKPPRSGAGWEDDTDVRRAAPLKSGMRVYHPTFGDGIVLNRYRAGGDFKVTVTFSRAGKKTLVEKYAKLEIL